jgi:hypothetical protein
MGRQLTIQNLHVLQFQKQIVDVETVIEDQSLL